MKLVDIHKLSAKIKSVNVIDHMLLQQDKGRTQFRLATFEQLEKCQASICRSKANKNFNLATL